MIPDNMQSFQKSWAWATFSSILEDLGYYKGH